MPSHTDPLAVRLADAPAWYVLGLGFAIVLATLLAVVLVVTVASATATVSPLAGRLHQAVVGLPVVLAFYEILRRIGLRAPAAWFLVRRPGRGIFGWVVVGLAFPAVVLGLQFWLLGARPVGAMPPVETAVRYLVASLAAGLLAGVLEELSLRGALLRVLEARWGPRIAVGATAAVFALLHQGHASDGVALALVVSSMFAAGLLLGTIVVRTRSVWHAVAVHAGWNTVFGGLVVSAATTGQRLAEAVIRVRIHDPAPLLAGVTAELGRSPVTTACLLGAVVVVSRYRGRWSLTDRRPVPGTVREDR